MQRRLQHLGRVVGGSDQRQAGRRLLDHQLVARLAPGVEVLGEALGVGLAPGGIVLVEALQVPQRALVREQRSDPALDLAPDRGIVTVSIGVAVLVPAEDLEQAELF